MIDKITSFGDSFMFGSDLPDCLGKIGKIGEHSLLTWPALSARELGLDYECLAESGRGNQAIAYKVFQSASRTSMSVINWTWIDRFDYQFESYGWPKTIRPDGDGLSDFYYRNIHTEFDDKIRNLITIHSTLRYLKDNEFPFIMTYMDRLILDGSEGIENLRNEILSDLHTFPDGQTFLEWSRSNGYPESDNWHPLEEAHARAAEIMLPTIEKVINTYIK